MRLLGKYYKIVFFIFLTTPSYAYNININVSGGLTSAKVSNKTTLAINSEVVNSYVTHKRRQTESFGGIGVSYSFRDAFQLPISIDLGISGYYFNFDKVKGIQHPFSNIGSFDTLFYDFKAKSRSLLIESRFISLCYMWQPYVIAGFGTSWNRLMDYHERPTDPDASAAPVPFQFRSHTKTSFTYELGVGIQHPLFTDLNHHIQYNLALDFRYLNLGKAQFRNFPAETASSHFEVSNLNTYLLALSFFTKFF